MRDVCSRRRVGVDYGAWWRCCCGGLGWGVGVMWGGWMCCENDFFFFFFFWIAFRTTNSSHTLHLHLLNSIYCTQSLYMRHTFYFSLQFALLNNTFTVSIAAKAIAAHLSPLSHCHCFLFIHGCLLLTVFILYCTVYCLSCAYLQMLVVLHKHV